MELKTNEIEMSVLSSLISFESIDDYMGSVDKLCFKDPLHVEIFSIIQKRFENNQKIDALIVKDALGAIPDMDEEDVENFFIEMNPVSIDMCHEYIDVLKTYRARRAIQKIGFDLLDLSKSEDTDLDTLYTEATSKIDSIDISNDSEDEVVYYRDRSNSVLEKILKAQMQESPMLGLPTGMTDLDKQLLGLQGSKLIIVAGRPGMGKTTLVLNWFDHLSLLGHRGIFFSLEMPNDELIMRSWSSISSIDNKRLKTGQLTQLDHDKLGVTILKTDSYKSVLYDKSGIDINKLKSKVRKEHKREPLEFIMLDYLQLMSMTPKFVSNRNEGISEITRELKMLSKELDVPVIALSQLSRDVEKRQDKRPINSDLRDSGAIEQDADIIIFTYRDEYYNPDSPMKGVGEAIISKFRDGSTGTVKLRFEGQYNRFSNLIEDPIEPVANNIEENRNTPQPNAVLDFDDDTPF